MTGAAPTGPRPDPVAAAQRLAQQRAARYHDILRRVARASGGRLALDDGVEVGHSVKSLDSLRDKVDREVRQYHRGTEEALRETADLNRYTLLFDEPEYTAGVQRAREALVSHGLTAAYGKNSWQDPLYKGYHAGFTDPALPHPAIDAAQATPESPRQPVEVQFHTPASFAAKQETHDLYALRRAGSLPADEQSAADQLRAGRTAQVPVPPGTERLPGTGPGQRQPDPVPPEHLDQLRERAAAQPDAPRGPPGLPDGAELHPKGPPPGLPPRQRRQLRPHPARTGTREDWRDLDPPRQPHRPDPSR